MINLLIYMLKIEISRRQSNCLYDTELTPARVSPCEKSADFTQTKHPSGRMEELEKAEI